MGRPVTSVKLAPSFGSYYYEDVSALQDQSVAEDERWFVPGRTEGFTKVRDLAETVSIGLVIDGHTFWGDCVGVSYAGKSGRRGLFRHDSGLRDLNHLIVPWLKGRTISSLRGFAKEWSEFLESLSTPLHPAIGYGLSQAVLSSLAPKGDFYRVIAEEWGLVTDAPSMIPLQGSCGNDRYSATDKMIARKLGALPQSQVDDVTNQLGSDGAVLRNYAQWIKHRILKFAHQNYKPVVSLDVHGGLGKIFAGNVEKLADFLASIETELAPFQFRIESPILTDAVEGQIELYQKLKTALRNRGAKVLLAADEWANTKEDIIKFADSGCVDLIHIKCPDLGSVADVVDAVLHVKKRNLQVLLGGSCVETDISTKMTVHIAMATQPNFLLVKPGMGFDEGFALCYNEMSRIMAK